MNPVRQILQSLRRTTKSWNIIVDPDPKRSQGLQRIGQTKALEFRTTLRGNVDLQEFLFRHPACGGASNIRSGNNATRGKSINTKWVNIVQVDSDMRNANGQTVRDALLDILDKFPSYDLQSELGYERAIRDIESKLGDFPSFEEENRECMQAGV